MSGVPAGAGSLIGKRLGKYDILALLALGGTAEIYLARIGGAAGFEKYVVVKCLHDHLADDTDFVKMFLDEARLAAMLDHSNIVQTFELGEHENRYYMVMEFLAGLSLAMVVRRANERVPGGKIPVPLILNVAAQASAGLHYAHEKQAGGKPLNMVHRDISPQNLVISFEGVVKIVDFGIARADQRDTKTKAGTIKGKFAYMSPEQCVAQNIDRRTDVFALGVIVWELLTGRRLFKRGSPYETYQAVIDCSVPTPSSLNPEIEPALDEIVMRAITKEKEQRYPTMEAFGDAMLKYLHARGRGSGPAEIGRFFDQYFNQEIEEHGDRMRELIAAGNFSVDTGVSWGGEDDDKKANETVDLGAKNFGAITGDKSLSLDSMDLEEVSGHTNDDDEIPAEKTRIQLNPLDHVKELDEEHARISARHSTPVPAGTATGGPAPLPAPPTGPVKAVVGARQSFPEMPNLPTQLGADTRGAAVAAQPAPDGMAANPGGPPQQPMPYNPQVGPGSSTHYAVRPSQMQPAQPMAPMPPQGPMQPQGPQGPYGAMPQTPVPYPHGPQGPVPYTPMPPGGMMPPGAMPPGAIPTTGSMYPVVHGGRPFSTDLAPSNLPSPQRSPYTGQLIPHPHHDPHHAAQMVSPVGDQYPHAMDWAAAAARPAKALPPWLLAVLFVGALGVALMLTIVIARIVR